MFDEVHGTHCEVCLTPAKEGFYKRFCARFHGVEFLCLECRASIDRVIGPRTLEYMETAGGCLFEELKFSEARLGVEFKRPEVKNGLV